MKVWFKDFCRNEEGAGLIEYSLLVVLIALAAAVGMNTLGGNLNTLFDAIATTINVTPPAIP